MTVRVFEGVPGEWEPSGDELVAAAEHAAERVERYERLAAEWNEELLRLADLARRDGGHRGLHSRLAHIAGRTQAGFAQRLKTWRRRNGA